LHQAVIGFEKWFGVTPLVTPELHRLVARDIDPDYQP
jgi:shikimate dehydrogenase